MREVEARVFQILDVDRETRDRAGGQWNIDQFEHSPLAADGRGLGPDVGPPALERGGGTGLGTLIPRTVDQFAAKRDDFGRVAPLDCGDERRVDQPERHVGAAIPHRKGRAFDQVGQGIKRGFGAAKLVGHLEPLRFRPGGVEQPQQQGASSIRRRGQPAAHLDRAVGPSDPHLARDCSAADRARPDVGLERVEVGRMDAEPVAGQIVEVRGHSGKAEVALEQGVGLDRAVGTDNQRPRGDRTEQAGDRARATEQ